MRPAAELARCCLVHVVALVVPLASYGLARLPVTTPDERQALASRFAFEAVNLDEPAGRAAASRRAVHPAVEHLEGWISTVGAAVVLADLDGDGLSNDACHVDPRFDRIAVGPLPGTGARYAAFELRPSPLPFDPHRMAPMGCRAADFDEDGRLDLLAYYWGRTPVLFLRRAETPLSAAAFEPIELVSPQANWYSNAATIADLDGDGHLDIVIGNYFADDARILDPDGAIPDLQNSMSRAYNGGRNRMFLWRGAARDGVRPSVEYALAEDGLAEDAAHGWTLALGAADLDGDLRPELYIANDFGADRLLHNRSRPGHLQFAPVMGARSFFTPKSKTLGHDSYKGMGVEFADVNGDGRLDIYVSNIAAEYALEESHFVFVSTGDDEAFARGRAPYVDRSEALGLSRSNWAWDARFADLDNDGVLEALQATGFLKGRINRWPELHELAMGNDTLLRKPGSWPAFATGDSDLGGHAHNPLFVRDRRGRYVDLAPELGLDAPQVTRGIAIADVDGDGRLDFAFANQWGASRWYHNRSPHPGAFLGLRLLLHDDATDPVIVPGLVAARPRERAAIGAVVTLRLADGRRVVSQVDGGTGHSGAHSPEIHFGLGESGRAPVRVEIAWRDARGVTHRDERTFEPGWHTVRLGSGAPRQLDARLRADGQ